MTAIFRASVVERARFSIIEALRVFISRSVTPSPAEEMHGLSFILALPVWLGARGGSALLGTSRRASPQAFFNIEIFNLGKPAPPRTTPAAAALLTLVRSGTATRAEIESAIDALPPSPASVSIDGRWRLDYTTEKEVLFLNKTLPLLGANVGIFQDICIGANGVGGGLENLVLFENGHLRVGSSATRSLDVDKRVDFAFDTVSLRVGELQLPLPPVGSGWFETCYCDDAIRVSRDVRGDTQVVSRVGPSQLYATADSPPSLDAALTVLKRAARDRSVSPTAAVSALLYVERSMRAEVKASPAVGAKQLAALDGAWRLVFTTGTLDTQAKLRGASERARASGCSPCGLRAGRFAAARATSPCSARSRTHSSSPPVRLAPFPSRMLRNQLFSIGRRAGV
jgi:hypothetical protein